MIAPLFLPVLCNVGHLKVLDLWIKIRSISLFGAFILNYNLSNFSNQYCQIILACWFSNDMDIL